MFKHLVPSQESITEVDLVPTVDIFDILIDSLELDMEHLHEAQTIGEAIERLEALKSAIALYGLDKPLLDFANYDGSLQEAVPEMPSLEAYLRDANVDLTAANEGMLGTIGKAARRWLDVFLMHLTSFRKWYMASLAKVSGFAIPIGVFASATLDHSLLKSLILPGVLVWAASSLALKAVHSTPLAIKEALALRLPTTVQERSVYIRKITAIFDKTAYTNLKALGLHQSTNGEAGKSAHELGYTHETIQEAIHGVSQALDELKRCTFVEEGLQKLAESVEATTSNGRAGLIFLTKVITKTLKLSISDTMKVAHSTKKIVEAAKHHSDEK